MGSFNPFKKPNVPEIAPPPPPPPPEPVANKVDEEVVRSKQRERRRAVVAQGRESTIVTRPQGLPSASQERRKTVLGV